MLNRRQAGPSLFHQIASIRMTQRSLKWAVLVMICGLFFVMQHIAVQYHNTNYSLLSLNQIQDNYAVIFDPGQDLHSTHFSQSNCTFVDKLSGRLRPPLENCTNFVNFIFNNFTSSAPSTQSSTQSSTRSSPLIDSQPVLHSLMIQLNRTFVDHRINYIPNLIDPNEYRELFQLYYQNKQEQYNEIDSNDRMSISKQKFDPNSNLDDRIHYLFLKQNFELDQFLQRNYSALPINYIDSSIDRRRLLGQQTNLKLSEFANITQIRYGDRPCDPVGFGSNLSLVIFVITKVDDFKVRQLIRRTWGKQLLENPQNIRLYFCFGQPGTKTKRPQFSHEMIASLVEREHQQFGDIIQWEFEDGYYRLTIKSLAILRWTSIYCPRAPNVLKLDTDSVVNYDNLLQFAENQKLVSEQTQSEYNIFGYMWKNPKVFRSLKNKFFTSHYDYPGKIYPNYLGSVWLLSGEALPLLLYNTAIRQSMPALLWEDLYVTGIVAQKLIDSRVPLRRQMMPALRTLVPISKVTRCQFNQTMIYTQLTDSPITEAHWKELNTKQHTIQDDIPSNSSCWFQL